MFCVVRGLCRESLKKFSVLLFLVFLSFYMCAVSFHVGSRQVIFAFGDGGLILWGIYCSGLWITHSWGSKERCVHMKMCA